MIEIDKIGVIKSGEDTGSQIKFTKASTKREGYYILMCKDFSDQGANIGDHQVDTLEDLEETIKDSNWVIEWS
jgi:hypothetical protein